MRNLKCFSAIFCYFQLILICQVMETYIVEFQELDVAKLSLNQILTLMQWQLWSNFF